MVVQTQFLEYSVIFLSLSESSWVWLDFSPWRGPSERGDVCCIWQPVQWRPPSAAARGQSTWRNLPPSPHQGWRDPPYAEDHNTWLITSALARPLICFKSWCLHSINIYNVAGDFTCSQHCGGLKLTQVRSSKKSFFIHSNMTTLRLIRDVF